ncbi:hypothetical protein M3Y98_01004100 [Aphelenchoides besseyi]|nr:hypothetical protein M3Y98_01004100 [Aphelenchoides besseyi]KAI6195185.1 hypothetical protein M3Y96_01204100 [Aphelenchoides besseyi]
MAATSPRPNVVYPQRSRANQPIVNLNDDYWRCCCRALHVHQAVLIIAILCTIHSICGVFLFAYPKRNGQLAFIAGFSIIPLLSSILLLIGNIRRSKFFYIPYLVFQAVALIAYAVHVVVITAAAIGSLSDDETAEAGYKIRDRTVFLFLFATFLSILLAIGAYFYMIVLRGYRYLQQLSQMPYPTTTYSA